MPDKAQAYMQMAEETAVAITGSPVNWMRFLATAARLYKYPYHEQLMIYAQRPDATACAEYDLWNSTMNRYVKRGSKGIALVDSSGDTPRLRYVFDVSDTGGGENARHPFLWQLQPEHESSIMGILENSHNVSSEDGLAEQLQQLAANLTVEYWFDNQLDILRIIDGSALEDYDGIEVEGEILLHKAAKRAFDELGIKKLPTVKALQSEYAELLSGKKKTYVEFVKARDEMKAVLSAKANVDRLLGEDKERQEKGHFQEK